MDAERGRRGLLGDDFQRVRKELKRLKQACRDADDALLVWFNVVARCIVQPRPPWVERTPFSRVSVLRVASHLQ